MKALGHYEYQRVYTRALDMMPATADTELIRTKMLALGRREHACVRLPIMGEYHRSQALSRGLQTIGTGLIADSREQQATAEPQQPPKPFGKC